MRRRAFLRLVGNCGVWSTATFDRLGAYAQQGRKWRIGYLSHEAGPTALNRAFEEGLQSLGYLPGENTSLEYRWAKNDLAQLQQHAAEFVASRLDLIVTEGNPATTAAKNATSLEGLSYGASPKPRCFPQSA
jgi:hypothetical protein